MAKRGPILWLLLLVGWAGSGARAQLVVGSSGTGAAEGTYDPCLAPPSGVNIGDPFVFGLAFWPGGTLSQWGFTYNSTSGQPGLNPCLANETTVLPSGDTPNYQDFLSAYGVVFATYRVKVDTLAGVRVSRAEMDAIYKRLVADDALQPVVSVIAFRGQNRSEAQYLRSNSSQATAGTGIVQSLSLLVSWDRGTFDGFTWYSAGPCDSCGGLDSGTCVQTQYDADYQNYPESACAWSFDECTCNAGLSCPANNCSSTVYMGHRGSDKSGRVMNTAYQIQQINKYSITSVFWRLINGVNDLLGNSGTGALGGGAVQQSSDPVVLGGSTDAELAQGQATQQQQGQPLAQQAADGTSPPPPPPTPVNDTAT